MEYGFPDDHTVEAAVRLAVRLLRATDQRRQEQERDRVIDAEQRRMKARYGR